MPSFSSVRRAGNGDCSTSRMISVLSDAEYLMPRLPHPRSCFLEWPAPPSGDVRSPAFSGGGMGMRISVLGVDLGKNVSSLVGFDALGAVVLRRRAKRETVIALAAKPPPCVVAMEACCGAHHLGRVFAAHGHDVRSMSLRGFEFRNSKPLLQGLLQADLTHPPRRRANGRYLRIPAGWNRRRTAPFDRSRRRSVGRATPNSRRLTQLG